MIKRQNGIIVQHDPNNPFYGDGGDSSRSTGVMATFGSAEDQEIITKHYVGNGLIVRNPFQKQWTYTQDVSRDQTTPMISGLATNPENRPIIKQILFATLKRLGFAQNGDLLNPAIIGQMILGAGIWQLYWFLPISYLFHILDLYYNCLCDPWSEQNQIMCSSKQLGTASLYKTIHPNWKDAVDLYWSHYPFRDQKEIAEQIKKNF